MEGKSIINNYEDNIREVEGLGVAIAFTDFRAELAGSEVVNPRSEKIEEPSEVTEMMRDTNFKSEDPDEEWNFNDFVKYGVDNQWPQSIEKIIRRNSKLRVGLAHKTRDLIGLGIETGRYDYATGRKQFLPAEFPLFDNFYDRANVFRNYLVPAAAALKKYYMVFVSVMLTEDAKYVAALKVIPNRKCRLSKPNANGTIKLCGISNYWDRGLNTIKDKEKVQVLPVIDSFFDSADTLHEIVKKTKKREFIYVLRVPTEEDFYSLPDYVSVIEQGWVDVSNDVPAFKRWVIKNLTTINLVMYVSESYFEAAYPDWSELKQRCVAHQNDEAERQKSFNEIKRRKDLLVNDIEEKLSGVKKSGKMITVPVLKEAVGNTAYDSKTITIESIKGNDYSGNYNADANEADAQILFALGVDPSITGNLTRTDSQGGTGKREGHNIAQASEYMFEQFLLEPLEFKRDYDKRPGEKGMKFRIARAVTPTLDAITPSERQIQPNQ